MNFKRSTLQHETMRFVERGEITPPEGVVLSTDTERRLWRQFTHARRPSDWREIDLVLIAKIIKLEVKEMQLLQELDETGDTIINSTGNTVVNPLWAVVRHVNSMKKYMLADMGIAYYRPATLPERKLSANSLGRVIDAESDQMPFLAS